MAAEYATTIGPGFAELRPAGEPVNPGTDFPVYDKLVERLAGNRADRLRKLERGNLGVERAGLAVGSGAGDRAVPHEAELVVFVAIPGLN